MKTRSPLTGTKHTAADYEAAKTEPVVLAPQVVGRPGRRRSSCGRSAASSAQILCPDTPDRLPRGRHRRLQGHHDARLHDAEDRREVGLRRGPRARTPRTRGDPRQPQDPAPRDRAGSSACAATTSTTPRPRSIDYRTGEVLAYVGSAQLHRRKGNKKFQPQFDVLSRRLAPARVGDQADQLPDRHRRQDADRRDDVHGRHDQLRRRLHPDPGRQARARPGPAPRGAPVLAQHPGHQGDDHERPRPRLRPDQGLRARRYPRRRVPVLSMGIGTLEVHPIDLLGAYGTIANGGMLMPRHVRSARSLDSNGKHRLAAGRDAADQGTQVVSAGAAYIITDILAGNTDRSRSTRSGASGRSTTARPAGRRPTRPARRATTATSPRTASSPRRPTRTRPALAVGVWMGNSDNTPERRQALARHVGAALVGDPDRGQQGQADRPVQAAGQGLVTATVDAFTGPASPARSRRRRSRSSSCPGTVPTQKATTPRSAVTIDAASGLLWQDGCVGPKVTKGFFDLSEVEANFPAWQKADLGWGARAARGSGVGGGPEGHADGLLLQRRRSPRSARTWGAPFAPTHALPALAPPPTRTPCVPTTRSPSCPPRRPSPPSPGAGSATATGTATAEPADAAAAAAPAGLELDDRRPVAALAALARPEAT